MTDFDFLSMTTKDRIKNTMVSDPKSKAILVEINELYEFMDSFDFLQFGRDFKFHSDVTFSPSSILSSATSTLLSIEACVEYSNISDAFILSRRFCEDLFFYLYIATKYLKYEGMTPLKSSVDDTIFQWLNNTLGRTDFNSKILGGIATTLELSPLIKRFQLKKIFADMRNQLNTYVHWNGKKYYNTAGYSNEDKYEELCVLLEILKNNIYYFIVMIAIITPASIMSSDYSDFFEAGMTPPEGIQYEIAPFVKSFLRKESERLEDDSLKYLTSKSPMKF